jgi:tRNA (guanine-N1)-methyltransferase
MVEAALTPGVIGRARQAGVLDIAVHNLRDFTTDRHRVVDDVPFGGGPGMVLKPEPLFVAVETLTARRGTPDAVLLMSPAGKRLTQAEVRRFAGMRHLVVLCGRYEGIDERVREHVATDEVSIGDYVLVRWRAAGAGGGRRREPARPGGRRRRAVGGRRFVYARVARLPALHASRGLPRDSKCRTC